MMASLFVAMPVSAATENVIDYDLPLDDASELTWVASGVTVSNADGIGGRDDVVKAAGLADSNTNTVGVKLPDGFAFEENDVLTYSIDVYSETEINPDMAMRNHGTSLNPYVKFYEQTMATGEWVTITKTFTFAEIEAKIADANSSGTFAAADNYAFYLRPRQNADVYLDNLKLAVSRPVVERENVVEITADAASEFTMVGANVTLTDDTTIGGVKAEGVKNANGNQVGVSLPEGFAFQEGDILTYSLDVYSDVAINPDIFVRDHSDYNPMITLYSEAITTGTWTTITKSLSFDEMESLIASFNSSGSYAEAGNYAVYLRPRTPSDATATVYVDNFTVTVARVAEDSGDSGDTGDSGDSGDTGESGDSTGTTRENVVDITADAASELTMVGADVTLADDTTIGGVKATGVSNSNTGIVGVKLPDGFAFEEGDILTYSVDVYSATADYKPDIYVRNHGSSFNPMAVFYAQATAANTWVTVTKTLTFEELEAAITSSSSGTFASADNYAVYVRPRDCTEIYVDNFTVTVSREVVVRGNIIDIAADTASDFTWLNGGTATDADGIGGRDDVVALGNLANSNGNTAGVKLPDGFAFAEGDILTYSFDVYTSITNPDVWLRNHGSALNPFATFYQTDIEADTWVTITKTLTFEELEAAISDTSSGTFATADNYALYFRPRQSGTIYVDNFTVTVSREGYVAPPAEHEHDWSDWATDGDENHKKTCSGCSEVLTEAHGWDDGVVTQEPTTDAEGVKTFTCSACGATYTETIEKLPAQENRQNVVDITADAASEITWLASSAVTATDVTTAVGGRTGTIKISGLANSNNNTAGIKLPDGFAFADGDIITYSVDVYSESTAQPDLWLRNHGSDLNPMAVFYSNEIAAGEWVTLTKTLTFEELEAIIPTVNSSGTFTTSDNYAFYLRPRVGTEFYVDNITFQVSRVVVERGNIIDIAADTASDFTWLNGGTATDADGIGGRDDVVALGNLANSNGNTAGVKLPDGFAFAEGDILTYSFDVYTSITNPDVWLRNHGSALNPFATFYQTDIEADTWVTITKTLTFEELEAAISDTSSGTFATADNYALYFRPRQSGTIYVDNFTVTVSRVGYKVLAPVIDIDAALDTSSELTWIASDAVTVTEADGVGSRDDVLKVEGLADSNNNTAGIKLPTDFAFQAGDVITYSLDVYADSAINPDIWLRNHGDALTPFDTFYHDALTANTWTTITKTVAFEALKADYDWTTVADYAVYIRPRQTAGNVYVDNFKFTVMRPGYEGDPIEPEAPHVHDWGEGVVTTEPTYETEGVRTYTCSGCGETKTETIDKLVEKMNITVGEAKARVGKEVTIPVTLSKNTCVAGLELYIDYDADALELVSAANGTTFPSDFGYTAPGDLTAHPVKFTWDSMVNSDVNGEILQLKFKIKDAAAAGDYTVEATVAAYTWVGNDTPALEAEAVNGKITATTFMLGDVNDNDVVDAQDIVLTRRYITGGWGVSINEKAADIDADVEYTARDVILLRRHVAGGYDIEYFK